MLRFKTDRQVERFLSRVPPKHRRQIAEKIQSLRENPLPHDSAKLDDTFRRADIGEYRIVYRFDSECLHVPLVGKRNDAQVYRQFRRRR